MIWSTPFVTEYESQYGPPQLEQAPKEMTYFGSGICSYRRFTAGAILSLTVPETTIRSACRGPGAKGITPSRMKSCRDIEVAMNSIAQQARPKLNTQREYLRPQLRTNLIGFGASLLAGPMRGSGRSTTPISVILSDPAEHTLLPGVREPRRDEGQEDEHLS